MRRRLAILLALTGSAACTEIPTAPLAPHPAPQASVHNGGFLEHFGSATLDPAWTVISPTRTVSPLHLPPNHYSLTDRPGFLRYYLDPWTHGDGFFNGYARSVREHSCCTHNAGLELLRTITGEHWRLEARGEFWLPHSNGRSLYLRVYFGSGGPGTYAAGVNRGRDVHHNSVHAEIRRQNGTTVSSTYPQLAVVDEHMSMGASAASTMYFRIERNGSTLSAGWSHDGTAWTMTSYDAGSDIDGLPQTVVLAGLMWSFLPTTYVDWDYITVEPTIIPVDIDVKPGSAQNTVNPRARGVIPVAILTTATFDAALVDRSSVRFGATGGEAAATHAAPEDVDGDGDLDLSLHFPIQSTGIACGATSAVLTGSTTGGQPIRGSSAITTTGCR